MAILINLEFTASTLNTSLQVGDNVYYTLQGDMNTIGGFATTSTPKFLGVVMSVSVDTTSDVTTVGILDTITPAGGSGPVSGIPGVYFSFSKSGKVNQNELIGYYALVKFVNNATEKAELFAVGTEVHENSK